MTQLDTLKKLIAEQSDQEGLTTTFVEGFGIYRESVPMAKSPVFYEPLICLVAQGKKRCHVGDVSYEYQAGDFFINFLPMPVTKDVIEASEQEPMLCVGLTINLVRVADIIVRIERAEQKKAERPVDTSSCVITGTAEQPLVDVFLRLLDVSKNPIEAEILGEAIVDEIYYRMLTSEHGDALRKLLNQYGQIQPISKVINYIHDNLDKNIAITELASLANMSKTSFFNAFKKLMHVPPIQYIKSSKLQKAQALLKQGMQANTASYQVGYNSFSQFTREYKRFFGYSPSQTLSY